MSRTILNKALNNEEPKTNNENDSIILKKTRHTGNYMIMKKNKGTKTCERIRCKLYGVYFPFGVEEYNGNLILNVEMTETNNYNYNTICTLKKIDRSIGGLKETELGKTKYELGNKEYYSFINDITDQYIEKKRKIEDKEYKLNEMKEIITEKKTNTINKYQCRMHIRYGAKVRHSKFVGEMTYSQIKGHYGDIEIEMGSLWNNDKIKQYGVTVYITNIIINK